VFEFDGAFAAIDMLSQGAIVRGFVEGDTRDFLSEHLEIVGYDAIELVVSPVLSRAGHSRKMNQTVLDV